MLLHPHISNKKYRTCPLLSVGISKCIAYIIHPSTHPSISSFRQHDAQEFLQSLLFLLHDELNKPKKRAMSPSPRNARYSMVYYLNDLYPLSLPLFPLVIMNWLKGLGKDLCALIIAASLVSVFKRCDFNF